MIQVTYKPNIMIEENVDIGKLANDVKEYAEAKIELAKLQAAEKVTDGFSSLVSVLIISFFGLIFLFTLSITLAIAFSYLTNSYLAGFGIVTSIYLLCIVLLSIYRTKLLKIPIMNFVISFIFDDKEEQIAKREINKDEKI